MGIGERIKNRRMQLGISAEQLATKIGRSKTTVYRYETEEIENMPSSVLEPIAKALLTTPAYLMGWDESPEDTETAQVTLPEQLKQYAGAFENGLKDLDQEDMEDMLELLNFVNSRKKKKPKKED